MNPPPVCKERAGGGCMLSAFFDSFKKSRPAWDDQTGGWDESV